MHLRSQLIASAKQYKIEKNNSIVAQKKELEQQQKQHEQQLLKETTKIMHDHSPTKFHKQINELQEQLQQSKQMNETLNLQTIYDDGNKKFPSKEETERDTINDNLLVASLDYFNNLYILKLQTSVFEQISLLFYFNVLLESMHKTKKYIK